MSDYALQDGSLLLDGQPVLQGLADCALVPDPLGAGAFLRFSAREASARLIFAAGTPAQIARFSACHRYEPFWMKARAGQRIAEVPIETQFLIVERQSGDCAILVPIIDGAFASTLQGGANGLELVSESNDPAVVTDTICGLFAAVGHDPYTLVEAGAKSVMAHLRTGRLRAEKDLPAFIDQFGWCTWDAFYQEVDHEKVRQGLASFAESGMNPRYLILDDGWQSVVKKPSGETRLTAFAANPQKFAPDLAATVRMAKDEFKIETFMVWHALHGYWGGVDGDALPGYDVRGVPRQFSPGILSYVKGVEEWWGKFVGVVDTRQIDRFYQDYHRYLREQGVDGVKVDSQSTMEGVCQGLGGRVVAMRRYHEGLEGSAQTHFLGNMINCMSCASEMLYSALNSNITRTSTDFWPTRPETHGEHLYVNAQVSVWFGEFIHPDWDMFQSGHEMGAFHAAGRAVGGCPVYVSDKPGEHDFDLLRKLVLQNGTVLRCPGPGRPTRDCLFHDPTKEPILLKIFNVNHSGSGVVGVFNAHPKGDGEGVISGFLSPADVPGLVGDQFAVYSHYAGELRLLGRNEQWDVSLPALTAEVFTIVPVEEGVAPIGLVDLFNSGGAVNFKGRNAAGVYEVGLRSGGRFVAWCENPPAGVEVDGEPAEFQFDQATGRLEMDIPSDGISTVRLY